MRSHAATTVFLAAIGVSAACAFAGNKNYPSNREPLADTPFTPLPLGAVRPEGWLRDQLTIQANGLTGHLDEFWPSLTDSKWKGGTGEGWERAPYYLDGLVPLAYLLEDKRLIAKVQGWMDAMLASGQPNGWFGPKDNTDRWPLAVALKVLTQYHEATGDPKAMDIIKNYCRFLKENKPDWPDNDWRGRRAVETTITLYWLYNRTGDRDLLDVAKSIQDNSFKWTEYFLDFPFALGIQESNTKSSHSSHVVNNAMAIKYPGIWWQQSKDDRYKQSVYTGIASLDAKQGQVAGRFCGDEHFCGRKPTQGTELFAVVEYMYSLENLAEVFGDAAFCDRLEMLAYNAQPAACTPDYWAHQYDQQSNQVLVSIAKRTWSTNDDTSNLYGLEPNFGCCTANMHQGWPKLVSNMWKASSDNGLAAIAYGPSKVTAKVGDGVSVVIREKTDYPWNDTIQFTLETTGEATFPLHLRIPVWADGAKLTVAGQAAEVQLKPGTFAKVERTWKNGDTVELTLPMELRTERRYNDAVAIMRGPLYFSLRIGEKYTKLRQHSDKLQSADWQIEPTTPWNYGLLLDTDHPDKSIQVETRRPVGAPFDNVEPAVVLRVKGRQIPAWTLVKSQAGDTPKSPVVSTEPITDLELVPYGNTPLRITEFPVIAAE